MLSTLRCRNLMQRGGGMLGAWQCPTEDPEKPPTVVLTLAPLEQEPDRGPPAVPCDLHNITASRTKPGQLQPLCPHRQGMP